jgi:hypothetical protein
MTCASFSWEPNWEQQEIEKGQKTNMQKAGVRRAGCSGGDAQQPHPSPASLLYTAANQEVEQHFLGVGGCDIVVIRTGEPATATL